MIYFLREKVIRCAQNLMPVDYLRASKLVTLGYIYWVYMKKAN